MSDDTFDDVDTEPVQNVGAASFRDTALVRHGERCLAIRPSLSSRIIGMVIAEFALGLGLVICLAILPRLPAQPRRVASVPRRG